VALMARPVFGQSVSPRPPVIDVHFHGTQADVARPDSLNMRYRLVTILAIDLEKWQAVDRTRLIAAAHFPCDHGRAPMHGAPGRSNGPIFRIRPP
jgi:hypothetical protein